MSSILLPRSSVPSKRQKRACSNEFFISVKFSNYLQCGASSEMRIWVTVRMLLPYFQAICFYKAMHIFCVLVRSNTVSSLTSEHLLFL